MIANKIFKLIKYSGIKLKYRIIMYLYKIIVISLYFWKCDFYLIIADFIKS